MKVAIIGNLGNLAYQHAKYLRKNGVDVDLYIVHNGTISKTSDPRIEDNLKELPSWIITWNTHNPFSFLKTLIFTLKRYDIIHAFTVAPLYCQIYSKKMIAHSTGSDIRLMAVSKTIKGRILARGYQKASKVFFNNPDLIPYFKKLKIKPLFIPFLVDIDRIQTLNVPNKNKKFICFHPSRWDWEIKGTDRILYAFKKFSDKHKNTILKLIDFDNFHYHDREKTFALIKKLNLSSKIKIIKHVEKKKLITEFYSSDVILEQFNKLGSFGLTTIEAMTTKVPVIHYINKKMVIKCYKEEPPLLNAQTEDQIYSQLEKIYQNDLLRKNVGKKCLKWINTYHNPNKITKIILKEYEKIKK